MFSKRVISSARFLKMPISTQALYFHLGMNADDDGVVEAYTVIHSVGASEDDLRVLVAKGFVFVLNEDLVSYISDWNENNKIRSDRKIDSIYQDLLVQMLPDVQLKEKRQRADVAKKQPNGQPMDNQWTPNGQPMDRTGKDRSGQYRVGQSSIGEESQGESEGEFTADEPPAPPRQSIDYEAVKNVYNRLCTSLPACKSLSDARKKAIKARFSSGYSMSDFMDLFQKAEASSFLKGRNDRNWTASFDWLIKDANMAKVLDGNYDDRTSTEIVPATRQTTQGAPDTNNIFARLAMEGDGYT